MPPKHKIWFCSKASKINISKRKCNRNTMKPDAILVLDFGGQYCHLIARRVREHKVYSEVVSHDITPEEITALEEKFQVRGLIFSGGPSSVHDENAPTFHSEILNSKLPVLGICYGHQLIAYVSGGDVKTARKKEYGITCATIDKSAGVLYNLGRKEKVWMSHGDTVYSLPKGFEILAHTENSPVAAFTHKQKAIYGLQWHPEVIHTENGMKMLGNFIFEVCECEANWNIEDFIEKAVEEVMSKVKDGRAIVALSGGIDSATATALAARAIGNKLTAVFVDHGFMREGEPSFVEDTFRRLNISFVSVAARRRFLKRLRGVINPEQKRKVIGEEFIRVFEEVANDISADYLMQGTI